MDRRAFLRVLGLGAAAVAVAPLAAELDIERLLWVPGAKRIFLPSVQSNYLLVTDWMMREVLRIIEDNLRVAEYVNREYDAQFRVGETFTIQGRYVTNPLT